MAVLDHEPEEPGGVATVRVQADPVRDDRLVVGHGQQAGDVGDPERHGAAEPRGQRVADERRGRRRHLLQHAEWTGDGGVRGAGVQVVEAELLMELGLGLDAAGEHPEGDRAAVTGEVAPDDVARRRALVEVGGEHEVRRGQGAAGEHDPPGVQGHGSRRAQVHGAHRDDGVAGQHEADGERVGAQVEPAPQEGGDERRGKVVLGADRAGEGVAGRAAHAGRAVPVSAVVDGERQARGREPDVLRRGRDAARGGRQRARGLGQRSAAPGTGGVVADGAGDVEQPLRVRVVRLEGLVADRPGGARVRDERGVRREVRLAEAQGTPP
ncbi:MAG: hypothetical protein M3P50_03880 [Actinomycetota bacterium]|nr:hypothetical protein [Actinomycetota bacterium]